MRLIVVGDVHLSVTPPGRRAEGYLDELLDMLEEIVMLANARDAVVVFVGDVFHHKRWSRVPHWLVQRVGQLLGQIRNQVIIIPGNHDLADGSIESLERQPLSLLDWVDNVTVQRTEVEQHIVTGRGEGIEQMTIAGIAGTAAVTDARAETLELYSTQCDVLVAHAPISIRELPWPTWRPEQLALDCNVMLYGHQHDLPGVVAKVTRGEQIIPVVATGCIARGALHEANHPPSVIAIEFLANGYVQQFSEIKVIELTRARPSSEIYRWAEKEAERAADDAMHSFVTSLASATLVGFSREALIQTIAQRVELTDAVRLMAVDILESVAP